MTSPDSEPRHNTPADLDDPRLTAYAFGEELSGEDGLFVQHLLAQSEEARTHVQWLRGEMGLLNDTFDELEEDIGANRLAALHQRLINHEIGRRHIRFPWIPVTCTLVAILLAVFSYIVVHQLKELEKQNQEQAEPEAETAADLNHH